MFMKTPKNLSGNKFGKWNVIDKADPIIGIDNRRKSKDILIDGTVYANAGELQK